MTLELLVLGIALLIVFFVVLTYNRLTTLRNQTENGWAQIDVQLKRRYDLIPNVVEAVKGYMKHEKETLETITKYRSQLITGTPQDRAGANNMITEALKTIFAVSENYPQLKASENFKMIQEELAGTENKISYVRTAYNDTILNYNTALGVFPNNMLAPMLGFKAKPYFGATEEERDSVSVKLN